MSNQPVGRYKNPEKVFNDAIKNCEHSLKVIYNVIEDSLSDRLKEYKIIYKKKSKKTSIIAPYKPFDIYWKKRTKLIRSLMKDAVTSKINDLGIDKNYYKHRYPTRGSKKDAIEKYEDFEEYSFSHRWHDIMKVVSDLIWGDIYAEGFAIAEDDTCPDIAAIKKELGVEVKGPKEVNIADLILPLIPMAVSKPQ